MIDSELKELQAKAEKFDHDAMMKEAEAAILHDRAARIRKRARELAVEMEKQKADEWPRKGDIYWTAMCDGTVVGSYWGNDFAESGRACYLNIFRTLTEAERARDRRLVMEKLWRAAEADARRSGVWGSVLASFHFSADAARDAAYGEIGNEGFRLLCSSFPDQTTNDSG